MFSSISTTTGLAVLSVLAGLTTAAPFTKRASGVQIQLHNSDPTATQTFCLATTSAVTDGTLLNFMLCSTTQSTDPTAAGYALWDISPGNQQGVKLTGTNFCLDAGSNPGPGMVQAKVWTCYDNIPQQQFYYTADDRIAVTDLTPCLGSGRYGAQFQQCVTGYSSIINQVMDLVVPGGTTTPTPTTTTSASVPSSTVTPVGQQIHPNGDTSKCLTVMSEALYNGAAVGIADCVNYEDFDVSLRQYWLFTKGQTTIAIGGGYFCLDFESAFGANGTPSKIWTCYQGLAQQTLYYTGDDHIAVLGGNQCLDVRAGTTNVQSWQCSGPDLNQLFTT